MKIDRLADFRIMGDLIFYNARVITLDPEQPKACLVATKGSRIVSVAGNEALGGLRAPGTTAVDCAGAVLMPGFVDAHCHVRAYAESLVSLNLSPREQVRSIPDIQGRIRDLCRRRSPGAWIRGKGYNEFYMAEKRHPNRWDLDAAAPLHPVKLTHRSGHAHVLNSLALEKAGITTETGDPPGGLIDRDLETGLPTGILYGMGEYLARAIPAVEDEEIERGLALADKNLLACGITSVQDASSVNSLRQWQCFESWKKRGLFHPRLTMMMGLGGFAQWQDNRFAVHASSGLKLGGVKIIVSRATGSVQPGRQELNERVAAIHAAGLQAVLHAVEEPEIEAAITAIEYSMRRHCRQAPRHRIEHCSVCPPALMQRISALGIAVVTQPSFLYFSGDRYLKTVAEDQLEHLYAIGSLLRNRVAVGFGSDFPISEPNPLAGVCAAVTRTSESGNAVSPRQGIGALDALRMHTLGGAFAGFDEKITGSITCGKLADFILLDADPCSVAAARIKDIRVVLTVVAGRVAWSDGTLPLESPA